MPTTTLKIGTERYKDPAWTYSEASDFRALQSYDTTGFVETDDALGSYARFDLERLPGEAVYIDQVRCFSRCQAVQLETTVSQGFYLGGTYAGGALTSDELAWHDWLQIYRLSPSGALWTVKDVNLAMLQMQRETAGANRRWRWSYIVAEVDWTGAGGVAFGKWWAPILFGLETLGRCLRTEEPSRLIGYIGNVLRDCRHRPNLKDYPWFIEELESIAR